MGMTLKQKMLPAVITNPEMVSASMDLKGISYIAKLRVWAEVEVDGKKKWIWKVYYYQKAFKDKVDKDFPLNLVKSYFGSSKGKNKTSPEMLQDMKRSPKSPEITIIQLCETPNAAFIEQKNITLHNFPLGGGHKDSIDCYNKNNGVGRYTISPESMLSNIQYERLSEKLKRHREGEKVFKEGFRTKEQIRAIIKELRYVQCRLLEEGNEGSIVYYADKMRVLSVQQIEEADIWNGKMTMFMSEDGNENNDEMLDGNESSRACIRVGNMNGLVDIQIPYSEHCYLLLEEKRTLGNEMNAPKEDRQDITDKDDVVRNCKNIIVRDKLYTSFGNPNFKHPLLWDRLAKLNFSTIEINYTITETKKYFKEIVLAKRKEQEGYYDFSADALEITKDDQDNPIPNNNLEQWNKSVDKINKDINKERVKNGKKPITFTETNTIKVSYGMYGYDKIALKILNWYKDGITNGKVTFTTDNTIKKIDMPQDLLVYVFFNFEDEMKKFCSTDTKEKVKTFFETTLFKAVCKNIMIKPVPMTKK